MPAKAKGKKKSKTKKKGKAKKIYCGAGDIPSGHRRGTMQECIEKNQIRYYGVKKIDSRILSKLRTARDVASERDKIVLKMKGYKHRIMALRKEFLDKKTTRETKVKLKPKILELNVHYKKYLAKFKKIDARYKATQK